MYSEIELIAHLSYCSMLLIISQQHMNRLFVPTVFIQRMAIIKPNFIFVYAGTIYMIFQVVVDGWCIKVNFLSWPSNMRNPSIWQTCNHCLFGNWKAKIPFYMKIALVIWQVTSKKNSNFSIRKHPSQMDQAVTRIHKGIDSSHLRDGFIVKYLLVYDIPVDLKSLTLVCGNPHLQNLVLSFHLVW